MKNLSLAVICASVFAAVEAFAGVGLPKEYQQVEYLQSTGTQYIARSGYTRNAKTSRVLAVWDAGSDWGGRDNDVLTASYRTVFGENDTKAPVAFSIRYNGSNLRDNTTGNLIKSVATGMSTLNVFFGNTATGTLQVVASSKTTNYNLTFSPTGYDSDPKAFPSVQMGIFCTDNSNYTDSRYTSWRYQSAIKLYALKIWERDDDGNDVLVRDYIPCYRKSDGTAGLYDCTGNTEGGLFRSNQAMEAKELFAGKEPTNFLCGPEMLNSNKIIIAYSRDDIPDGAGASPACGMSDLTPGEEFTALVANPSVLNPSKTFRYTVTGWERIVRNAAGTTVTSNGVDDVSTCTFTPAEGDEVYLTWIWKQEEASASKFQVRDASGDLIGTTYTDLAAAFAVATNGCAVELLADSVWDAPITITDQSIRLKSVDGARYTLTRISADAAFVLNQETTALVGAVSERILFNGSTYYYPVAQLIVTNLVVNCGSQDGVSGGYFALLKMGQTTSDYKHMNTTELKLENGAEICYFETDDDYMVKREDWQSSFRMRPGSWIHHISGKKGIYGVTDTSTHGQRSVVHIEGAKISDCTVTGDSSALIYLAFSKSITWNTIRFVDAVITNNLVASDFRGTVYLSCATTAAGEAMFNIGGNVRITDNFLLDGVTPANVRINTNTKMDIHQKLGDEACIGLKRRSNDAMVDPVEGAEIGFVTPTADKGKANAIYYDGNTNRRSFFGKIVGQTVVWSQKKGLMLILR